MRIVFVRHGHPNYKGDCLTELGHEQAKAAAEVLANERPIKIYASPLGRAQETAEHIAKKLEMSIETLDFMREIGWGSDNGEPINRNGHPWYMADDLVTEGESVMRQTWDVEEPFSNNTAVESVKTAYESFDKLLAEYGYVREGYYYRVEKKCPDTIFVVSHGGSSSAVISHMLNIAFPHFCAMVRPDFTSITTLDLWGDEGSVIIPHVEVINDARHIKKADEQATFDK